MMEELKQKVNEVYNWTVEDGKPQPPKQNLPQAVKDRTLTSESILLKRSLLSI